MSLLIIFTLNLITSALQQLKYIIANKDTKYMMYILIALDTVLYLYSLKLVIAKDDSFISIVILTLGKLMGVKVANIVENKLIKKIYVYNFYFLDLDFVKELEQEAHKENISITTTIGFSNGIKRYISSVHVTPQQEKWLFDYLNKNGNPNPTADSYEVKKIFGKIQQRTLY